MNDVIIDTGTFLTIISSDFLEELNTGFTDDDVLIEGYGYGETSNYDVRKRIDTIACDDILLSDFKIDFDEIDPDEKVNGLLLDFLFVMCTRCSNNCFFRCYN